MGCDVAGDGGGDRQGGGNESQGKVLFTLRSFIHSRVLSFLSFTFFFFLLS